MKKNLVSVLALVLAVLSLVLAVISLMKTPEEPTDYSEQISALTQENAALRSKIDALIARLDAVESGKVSAYCNLFVNSWEEQNGALVLTSAYIQTQVPSDDALSAVQLVLNHNGAEAARVDILLEPGTAEGLYERTLTDTWFILPEMEDDDTLDLYLEVTFASGEQLISSGISWYRTGDALYSVVG